MNDEALASTDFFSIPNTAENAKHLAIGKFLS